LPKILRLLKIKDIITLIGSFFAIISIMYSIHSLIVNDDYWLLISAMFIFFSMCTDTLDGWVARKFNQGGNELGIQIDSLSDCISFCVAPAILMYAGFGSGFLIIPAGIFTVCGVLRLAWFNIEDTTDGYIGLVTPISASTLLSYFLGHFYYIKILEFGKNEIKQFYMLFEGYHNFLINGVTVSVFMVIIGFLNLADFLRYTKKVRKKRGKWKLYIAIAAISVFTIIILSNISVLIPDLWVIVFIIAHIWSISAFYGCIAYIIWGFVTWYKMRGV